MKVVKRLADSRLHGCLGVRLGGGGELVCQGTQLPFSPVCFVYITGENAEDAQKLPKTSALALHNQQAGI